MFLPKENKERSLVKTVEGDHPPDDGFFLHRYVLPTDPGDPRSPRSLRVSYAK